MPELFTREPVAAGAFYPLDFRKLRETIEASFPKPVYKKRTGYLNGMISPHAGYMYSGKTAGHSYYELSKHEARTFVIIGPNHTGLGDDVSIMYNAFYSTPLGTVKTDVELGRRLCKELNVTNDFLAHSREHCIECQLPFLQVLYGEKFKILPIVLGEVSLDMLKRIGSTLADEDVTIIASSDFTHHGNAYGYAPFTNPKTEMYEHDMNAIKLIQELNVNEFHKLGTESTICGYKPITALMQAMKIRKAESHFMNYSTSADVTKDYENVVSYASIIFK